MVSVQHWPLSLTLGSIYLYPRVLSEMFVFPSLLHFGPGLHCTPLLLHLQVTTHSHTLPQHAFVHTTEQVSVKASA